MLSFGVLLVDVVVLVLFLCCDNNKIVFTRGCFVVAGVVMFLLFGCCLCGGLLSLFLWLLLKVVDVDVVVTSFSMLSFHGCCDLLCVVVVGRFVVLGVVVVLGGWFNH